VAVSVVPKVALQVEEMFVAIVPVNRSNLRAFSQRDRAGDNPSVR